jgi:predicted MFS family arabinose efflux permease
MGARSAPPSMIATSFSLQNFHPGDRAAQDTEWSCLDTLYAIQYTLRPTVRGGTFRTSPAGHPPTSLNQLAPATRGGSVSRRELGVLLALSMTASTLVIPAYGSLSRFLIEEFGISRAELGWLVTSVTAVAALIAPRVGRLTDALGGAMMLLIVFGGSTTLLLLVASAPTFQILLLTALVAGFVNAAGNPAGNKLVVAVIPPGGRGVLMGVKQSGVQIGTFLAGATLPGLALRFGWRSAIALMALVPGVATIWSWRLKRRLKEPRRPRMSAEDAIEFKAYRHPPGVRMLAIYAFAMGGGVACQAAFLPLYAQERVGLSVTQAGFTMAIVGLVGIMSRIMWSQSSERRGSFSSPLRMMALLSVISISCIMAADNLGAGWLWVGATISGASVVAWNGVANLGAIVLVDARHAGHSSGFVVLGFLAGFAVAPPLFGYLVETTGNYSLGWSLVLVSFALAGLLMQLWSREEGSVPAHAEGGADG